MDESERSELLSDIEAPVSATDDCDDSQPQISLFGDVKEADRLPVDSRGAESTPREGNAPAQSPHGPTRPTELDTENGSPTESFSEHTPTINEPTISKDKNLMIAAQVDGDYGVHAEDEVDHTESGSDDGGCFPSDTRPADDVPLLTLSADDEASPLHQPPPYEINQHATQDHENVDTTYAEIFSQIYDKATSHDENNDDRNCCDVYCGKSCHLENDGCRRRALLTETLSRGRDVGRNIFHSIVFPLVSTMHRRVWIASLWLPAFLLVGLSLATIIANGKESPYIAGILLCGIFVVYCIVDTTGTELCHFQLGNKKTKAYNQLTAGEGDNSGDEQSSNRIKKWQKMIILLDFLRLIVPELILFPIVACDLYSLVVDRNYTGQSTIDFISFVKFLVSCVTLLIHSHIVRLAVIATTAHRLHTKRTPPVELLESNHLSDSTFQQPAIDTSLRRAGLQYWKVFIIHVVLQILNQVLLFVALGFKLHDYVVWTEAVNYNPNVYFNEKATIKVEVALFMLGAYLLPILGLWLFFVVTYHWLHEFLVGLTVDFVSMLQLPGAAQHFFPLDVDHGDEKVSKIIEYVDLVNLKREYTELHSMKSFMDKSLYPFRNCVLTLLCTLYSILQIVYLSIALIDIKNRDTVNAVFYIISTVSEVVSSFSAFFIGVFWILFFALLLLCLCVMYTKRWDATPQYNYVVRPYNPQPIQRQYVTTGPRTTPRLHQPVMAARQPTMGYYPSFAVSGRPATSGQLVVRQNAPRIHTADTFSI